MNGKIRFSISHISMLIIALLLLGFFVEFQELAIDSPGFLGLMFFSFIFLGAGTFLTILTFAKSSEAEKFVCSGVAIVFIVSTLFVANSLAQVPRGGAIKSTPVTPENFTLTITKKSDGTYVGFSSTQILYSADYPVGSIHAYSSDQHSIRISTQNAVRLDATLIFNLWLLPYDESAHTQWETISFGSGQWGESYIFVYPHEIAIKFEKAGRYHPENRVRLEGYYLEFTTGMIAYNADPDLPSTLDFTFDMSHFPFGISDLVIDTKFENGLSITLSGILTGINCYIPGNLLSNLWFRKLLKKRPRKREMYADPEEREKILALIIVTFSFLSVPVLLFLFFVLLYTNANYLIQFYNTRSLTAASLTVLLVIINAGLFFLLRTLIKWARK